MTPAELAARLGDGWRVEGTGVRKACARVWCYAASTGRYGAKFDNNLTSSTGDGATPEEALRKACLGARHFARLTLDDIENLVPGIAEYGAWPAGVELGKPLPWPGLKAVFDGAVKVDVGDKWTGPGLVVDLAEGDAITGVECGIGWRSGSIWIEAHQVPHAERRGWRVISKPLAGTHLVQVERR